MDDDDLQPRSRLSQGRPLDTLSVEELEAYATALQQELEQVQSLLKAKQDYRSGAESLFKL